MRVLATAARSADSNAVGRVELECTPLGLVIDYQGVGASPEGYAPGALTSGTRIVAPWSSIEEAHAEVDRLWLVVRRALTPLNRMMLLRFRLQDSGGVSNAARRRTLLWLGVGVALALLVLLWIALSRLDVFNPSALALVLGLVASASLLVVGYAMDQNLTKAPSETQVLDAFLHELSGYVPAIVKSTPRPRQRRIALTLDALHAALPRSTSAVVITLAACGLAALTTLNAVVQGARTAAVHETRSSAPEGAEAPGAAVAAPAPVAPPLPSAASALPTVADQTQVMPTCRCSGPQSLLWHEGLPRLSTVLIERRLRAHKNHFHLELQLAAVNNGSSNIDHLTLRVRFFETDPLTQKGEPTKERPLYFAGPLRPGRAIKWDVQARGNHYDLSVPDLGVVGADDGSAAAPEAFAQLLRANHRPVRLHGALMLSFLGDSRARDAISSLRDALRENEGPYLDRLLFTTGPVITCNTTSSPSPLPRHHRLEGCVFNRSDQESASLTLQARALHGQLSHADPLAEPPVVIGEQQRAQLPLPRGSGRRVRFELDTSHPDQLTPDLFELQVLQP